MNNLFTLPRKQMNKGQVIPAATFGLGVWQIFRWRWKLGLIDEMEKLTNSDTVPFSYTYLVDVSKLEYKKIRVKGHFDSTKDVLLGPRSLITGKGESKSQGLISHGGKSSGYLVLSPFTITDSYSQDRITIIVNRGWVPNRKVEKFRTGSDEVEITGVVRTNERRSPFMTKNRPESRLWMFRDIPSLAEYFQSSEFFVDLTNCTTISDKTKGQTADSDTKNVKSTITPIPCQTRVSLRNEHVSYFVTWFSLSGITTYMWYKLYLQKRKIRK